MLAAVGDDAEDGLVLLDPGPVDDLDEVQLADRLPGLGGERVARRGLELRAVPALVDGVCGGERLVGRAELDVQVRGPRLGPARGGDPASDGEEDREDDDDDDDDGERAQELNSTRFG